MIDSSDKFGDFESTDFMYHYQVRILKISSITDVDWEKEDRCI